MQLYTSQTLSQRQSMVVTAQLQQAIAFRDPGSTVKVEVARAGGGAPPEFMSTHPSSSSRIAALQAAIPKVMPLYEQAR